LSEIDKVVAIKNSTSRLDHFIRVFLQLKDKVRIFGFGMDELGLTLLRTQGGDGTMGAAGVLGRDQPGFYDHLWRGDLEGARACGALDQVLMQQWFTPSLTGRFGSAQATLKEALNQQGLPGGFPRRPLLPLSGEGRDKVRATLQSLGKLPPG
jgi:4-hydroxy-tetrahydrodipicolinate synthase